ncbi:MAG: type II toxin-antitoxin system VapC family toxin [Acidobacteria bacterium]|uniref:Ribonuclease VapC n=1 Tax=Candidatus Polarisedimenticola svalbardensis TaxID=2886004 RepID=A0A8J6Y301_9BACT|nr:type II toxin-antitoxin system VapC family toxin [Candidatus Polarisedimenticola svalbardensis]
MNVVDSSAWLEYFADGPNAGYFSRPIRDTESLVVPVLTIYEVFKRVLQQTDEGKALQAVAAMQQGQVVELGPVIAMVAAKLSIAERLPMADSIILATARAWEAKLYTQDADFEGMPGVRYRKRGE